MNTNQRQKILVWKPKQIMQNLNTKQIAVMFIQLDLAFDKFDTSKKDYKGTETLFNPKAFRNAYKLETNHRVGTLDKQINKLKELLQTPSGKLEVEKILKSINRKFTKLGKDYDTFDLIFGDILFSPAFHEDKKIKELSKKKTKKKKLKDNI